MQDINAFYETSRQRHPEWNIPPSFRLQTTDDVFNIFPAQAGYHFLIDHCYVFVEVVGDKVMPKAVVRTQTICTFFQAVIRKGYVSDEDVEVNYRALVDAAVEFNSNRLAEWHIPLFVWRVHYEHYYLPRLRQSEKERCGFSDCPYQGHPAKDAPVCRGCGQFTSVAHREERRSCVNSVSHNTEPEESRGKIHLYSR